MDAVQLRRKIANTRFAALAALPKRVRIVGGHDWRILMESAKWLIRSREYTNWTYDLTPLNMNQLAWFVANITQQPVGEIRGYMVELLTDEALAAHVTQRTLESDRRQLANPIPRYGRRLGWYAIVRVLRPEHVVETGTDKGLGTVVLAAALIRNGRGRVTTVDINPAAGYLVSGKWAEVSDYMQGDSHEVLRGLMKPIDIFIHDSLHTVPHESAEYKLIEPRLSDGALVISDNAHCHPTLMNWAESRGWAFEFFHESPADHWFAGGGIGVAHPLPARG